MGIKDENIDNLKLKKMMDDSLDKKFKEFSKETEKNRLTDKKEILKELKARDEKGLNTLAQKFEMLKLNKEINKEKPSKNPLVAISDKNLKWLSEHAIANQKGDNLAEIAKNFAKSFTKTHKKEDNKEDKNKDKKEKDYTTLPVVNPMEEDTASTSILKAKVTMEDKIDEIHQLITKGYIKEQKTTTQVLSKGLDGIKSTMKTTGKIIGEIADKGKKLTQMITLGALGLLAIVGWFKEGGPEKLADAIKDKILPTLLKALDKGGEVVDAVAGTVMSGSLTQSENAGGNLVSSVSSGSLNAKSELDYINKNLDTDNKMIVGKTQQFTNVDKPGNIDTLRKNGTVSKSTSELMKKYDQNRNFDVNKITGYQNTKGGTKLSFPVPVRILNVQPAYEEGGGVDVVFERGGKGRLDYPIIIVSNIINLIIDVWNQDIPKNTTIGVLGPNGKIIGDYQKFIGEENDLQKYMNVNAREAQNDENAVKFRNKKGVSEEMGRRWNNLNKDNALQTGAKQVASSPVASMKEGYKFFKDKYDEHFGMTEEGQETPKADVTQISTNKQKINEQSKELQEQPQTQPVQDVQTNNTQNGQQSNQKQNVTVVPPSTPTQHVRPNVIRDLSKVLPGKWKL